MLLSFIKYLPIFPIYYQGKTEFYPIHVTDVCEIIEKVVIKEIKRNYRMYRSRKNFF